MSNHHMNTDSIYEEFQLPSVDDPFKVSSRREENSRRISTGIIATPSGRTARNYSRPFSPLRSAGYRPNSSHHRRRSHGDPKYTEDSDINSDLKIRAKSFQDDALQYFHQSAKKSACCNHPEALTFAKKSKDALENLLAISGIRYEDFRMDELSYIVNYNLAYCYEFNGMVTDAISIYKRMIKSNKQSANQRLVRASLGQAYFAAEEYSEALRMYRMALDQTPPRYHNLQGKLKRNIGIVHSTLNQFSEAIPYLEEAMIENTDTQSGLDLIICCVKLGDITLMKKNFKKLIEVADNVFSRLTKNTADLDKQSRLIVSERSEPPSPIFVASRDLRSIPVPTQTKIQTVGKEWLQEETDSRKCMIVEHVSRSARIVARMVDLNSSDNGYDWVIDMFGKTSFAFLKNAVQVAKVVSLLKSQQSKAAKATLDQFETGNFELDAQSAACLSVLYLACDDLSRSNQFASMAIEKDRFSPTALICKGNCFFRSGNLEDARDLYLEAIGIQGDCIEAMYNFGLVERRMGHLQSALRAFEKVHRLHRQNDQVVYQIGLIHCDLKNYQEAEKWLQILTARIPTELHILSTMGKLFGDINDSTQSLRCFKESLQYNPVNIEVLSRLADWHFEQKLFVEALSYFDQAKLLQPFEVKWDLSRAACYQCVEKYDLALQAYQDAHRVSPNNIECLQRLVSLCGIMGISASQYEERLAGYDQN